MPDGTDWVPGSNTDGKLFHRDRLFALRSQTISNQFVLGRASSSIRNPAGLGWALFVLTLQHLCCACCGLFEAHYFPLLPPSRGTLQQAGQEPLTIKCPCQAMLLNRTTSGI